MAPADYDAGSFAETEPPSCIDHNYGSLGRIFQCGFGTIEVYEATPQYAYVYRYDLAWSWTQSGGWVRLAVDHYDHYTQCPERCSIRIGGVSTSTWWADASGGGVTSLVDGRVDVAPGFTWLYLQTDVYFWQGQWVRHSLGHWYRSDGSFYS